ncbi:MAG TPA: CDP-alcohol phosphatidyltransferase family protein, partial [Acidimicrobiales bacterium]|nr:CDP-alcohol phosphatidyltransferase family protein [Acidimicrobiales bacterium]
MAAEPAPAGRSLPGSSAPGEDRILTVPNAVTAVRLGCVPVFVVLVAAGRPHWFAAAALLAVLGITDGVDGFIARHFHQVSTLGKVLDPLADRLLLGTAGISILVVGALPTVVAVLALGREAVVAAGFLIVAVARGRRIDVSVLGKAQTLLLMCALPLF